MAKNATIKKLVVKGTVSSTAPSGGYMPVYAGGVVGQSDGGVTLEEVASYVDVTMTNSTSKHRRDPRSGWQRLRHYDQELRELRQADCGGQRRGTYRRPERDFSVGRQGCN